MMLRALILFFFLTAGSLEAARQATGLSAKGIEHLKNGQYSRSVKVLREALKKTLISGREDWVIKASLNLVDLELTAFNLENAKAYLNSLPESEEGHIQALSAWKKAQLAYYQGDNMEREKQMEIALGICAEDYDVCPYIVLDSYRMQVKEKGIHEMESTWQDFLNKAAKNIRSSAADINALVLMKKGAFAKADEEWDKAIDMYREAGRLTAMAHCQNKKALSLLAQGEEKKARELNQQAVMVFNAMGLKKPSLQCQLLELFFSDGPSQMDKIQKNLDIVGLTLEDWEIQFALKNYQNLAPVSLSVPVNSP